MTKCSATTTSGGRCKLSPQQGTKTCHMHNTLVKGEQVQAKIVEFVQQAGHVLVTISEMKAKFCTSESELSEQIKAKMDKKERKLDCLVKQLEILATQCVTQNVEAKVDKLREKFDKQKDKIFALIIEHCRKKKLSPAYIVPEYPPSHHVVEAMAARDGKTEQRYVRLVTTFFSIFTKWSVFGLTKSVAVFQWLANHYIFTFFFTLSVIIRYPQQVGKRVPVFREIIMMIETMLQIHEKTQKKAREFMEMQRKLTEMYRFIFDMISRVFKMKISNPLRLISDSIHRMREKGNLPPQLESHKIDKAFKLWEQQTRPGLPMPDNVFLPSGPSSGHTGKSELLVATNYTTWLPAQQEQYVIMSVVGMMLLMVKRLWR